MLELNRLNIQDLQSPTVRNRNVNLDEIISYPIVEDQGLRQATEIERNLNQILDQAPIIEPIRETITEIGTPFGPQIESTPLPTARPGADTAVSV